MQSALVTYAPQHTPMRDRLGSRVPLRLGIARACRRRIRSFSQRAKHQCLDVNSRQRGETRRLQQREMRGDCSQQGVDSIGLNSA